MAAEKGSLSLRAGPAPHWRFALRRRHVHLAILAGLLPTAGAALWVYGWSAAARLGLVAGAAVLVELVTQRAMRQPVRVGDFSAVLQGLLLGFLMPADAPWWLLLVGVVAMVVIGKQIFGGTGGYPVNPVFVAWAVLLLSWGNRMTPIGDGALGTGWLPAVWIGGVALVLLGHVRWQAPVGMLLGVVVTAGIFGAAYPGSPGPLEQLATGSVALGIFFLSTDPTCAPANPWPRLLFGLLAGTLLVILRQWGTWAEPVPFALLLANLTSPVLDRTIRAKPLRRITSHA